MLTNFESKYEAARGGHYEYGQLFKAVYPLSGLSTILTWRKFSQEMREDFIMFLQCCLPCIYSTLITYPRHT